MGPPQCPIIGPHAHNGSPCRALSSGPTHVRISKAAHNANQNLHTRHTEIYTYDTLNKNTKEMHRLLQQVCFIVLGVIAAGYIMGEYITTGYITAGYGTSGDIAEDVYWLPRRVLICVAGYITAGYITAEGISQQSKLWQGTIEQGILRQGVLRQGILGQGTLRQVISPQGILW